MAKIRFFFLQVLFFGAPLVYAWLYIPFIGIDLSDIARHIPGLSWSGFESVKVTFLFFCIVCSLFFYFLSFLQQNNPSPISRSFSITLIIIFLWTIVALALNQDLNPYFTFGNPEKRHGWFFYIALLVLFFLLRTLTAQESRKLINMSFLGFAGVALYAIFQKLGLDPLQDFYQTRLDTDRIFSTLGNPNYLAGLVLMILPLMHESLFAQKGQKKALWDIVIWIIGGLLIYWTGSYLAWIFFALYVFVILIHHIIQNKSHRFIFWIICFLILIFGVAFFWNEYSHDILEMEKMRGFIARFYLWQTGLTALTSDIGHFLFGYGPDGFLPISEHFRHPLLSVYEDPAYHIDRSHNFFIDFALHFGVIIFGIALVSVTRILKYISPGKKISLLFFALYFSFNIPVLVHFLLVLQILASFEKKRIIRG